jgi:hypothetical protein
MYDLLTGRPPFVGRTAMEVITALREAVAAGHYREERAAHAIRNPAADDREEAGAAYQTMGDVISAGRFPRVDRPVHATEEHT